MEELVRKLNENGWDAEIEDEGHILATSSDGYFVVNVICWHEKPIVRASLVCCFDRWGNAFYESKFNNYDDVFAAIVNEDFKPAVASEVVFALLEEDRFNKSNKWLDKLTDLYEEYIEED